MILGGGVAPLLLMIGLEHTSAAGASLLLNLEVVFTALLAWAWFRDGVTARVGLGLAFVVAGAAIVSWEPGRLSGAWGAAAVAGACAAWGLDNNLTQLVSAKDPQQIAMIKGLVAGAANLVIGTVLGGRFPSPAGVGAAALIGVVGYGLSLVLFVTALRHLGTARTGGIFAVAPFVGVVVAVVGFGEPWRPVLGPAALLMAIGVVLQLGDRHDHQHHHERMVHDHAHRHDDGHHDHAHAVPIEPGITHAHEHVHEARTHRHPHQPDIHHRHRHHHRVGRS